MGRSRSSIFSELTLIFKKKHICPNIDITSWFWWPYDPQIDFSFKFLDLDIFLNAPFISPFLSGFKFGCSSHFLMVVFPPIVSRSSVCDRRIRLQGQLAGVLASSAPTGHGVLLQPGPGPCGEHVHQRPGVLRFPGGPRHGVLGLQKGNHKVKPAILSCSYDAWPIRLCKL